MTELAALDKLARESFRTAATPSEERTLRYGRSRRTMHHTDHDR